MNTNTKKLTLLELVFLRPAKALSVLIAVLAILIHPYFNVVIVSCGYLLYLLMYQFRGYIYMLGLSRFYFLGLLFYLAMFLSSGFSMDFSIDAVSILLMHVGKNIFAVFTNPVNYNNIVNWALDRLDALTHWKMFIFAPIFAIIFYILNVELDRKKIRQEDMHQLNVSLDSLYRFNPYVDLVFYGLFMAVCGLYSGYYLFVAFALACISVYLNPRIVFIIGLVLLAGLALFNLLQFNYAYFLLMPHTFFHFFAEAGLMKAVSNVTNFTQTEMYGQTVIFIPYLLATIFVSFNAFRNKQVLAQVAADTRKLYEVNSDPDALEFAQNLTTGQVERLTHKELNMHMFINGTTGSGKTVAFMNFVIDACEKNLPLVYLDGKGAVDLAETIGKIAARYRRTFRVFTLSPHAIDNPMCYDFLGSGNYTERKNRIMNLFIVATDAATSFYQDKLEFFVNNVFRVIEHHQLKIDLYRFLKLINNIDDLIQLADKADDSGVLRDYFVSLKADKGGKGENPRLRILEKLDVFVHSVYGHLFDTIGKDNVINLKQSILNNEIILFLFDASAYALDTPKVAKMVISDINSTFSEFGLMRPRRAIKTYCCFDEYKSYETEAIASSIALHRSNGMQAVIGTQSISVVDHDIANAILANCNTYLVLASASDRDARTFADTFGTYKKYESSTHIKTDVQEVTSITSRQVEDFIVSPQDIKNIVPGSGMGYLYRKAAGKKPVKVLVHKKY